MSLVTQIVKYVFSPEVRGAGCAKRYYCWPHGSYLHGPLGSSHWGKSLRPCPTFCETFTAHPFSSHFVCVLIRVIPCRGLCLRSRFSAGLSFPINFSTPSFFVQPFLVPRISHLTGDTSVRTIFVVNSSSIPPQQYIVLCGVIAACPIRLVATMSVK